MEVPDRRKQILDTLVMTVHTVIVAKSLSPKSGVNAVDNLRNKYARQRQHWLGAECSNNKQHKTIVSQKPLSLLSVAPTDQLQFQTARPETRINTRLTLLNGQEANREQREK